MQKNKMVYTIDKFGRIVLPTKMRETPPLKEKTKDKMRVDKKRNEAILKTIFGIEF